MSDEFHPLSILLLLIHIAPIFTILKQAQSDMAGSFSTMVNGNDKKRQIFLDAEDATKRVCLGSSHDMIYSPRDFEEQTVETDGLIECPPGWSYIENQVRVGELGPITNAYMESNQNLAISESTYTPNAQEAGEYQTPAIAEPDITALNIG